MPKLLNITFDPNLSHTQKIVIGNLSRGKNYQFKTTARLGDAGTCVIQAKSYEQSYHEYHHRTRLYGIIETNRSLFDWRNPEFIARKNLEYHKK